MIKSDSKNDTVTLNRPKELSESTSRSNLLSIIDSSVILPSVLDSLESNSTTTTTTTKDTLSSNSYSHHSNRRFLGGRPTVTKERDNALIDSSKRKGKEINSNGVTTAIDSKAIIEKVHKEVQKGLVNVQEKESRGFMGMKRTKSSTSGESFLTSRSKARSFNSIQKWKGEGFDIGGDTREFERRRKERQEVEKEKKEVTPIPIKPIFSPLLEKAPVTSSDEEQDEDIYYDAQSTFARLSPIKLKSKPLRPTKSILRINSSYSSPPLESTNSFITTSPAPLLATTKTVQFSPSESKKVSTSEKPVALSGNDEPISVAEVLARPSDEAGMIIEPDEVLPRGEISKDEMMLVQVSWTARQDLPDSYDENSARKFPVQHRGFEEFQVIWKRGRIELWSERSSFWKPFRSSPKKLVHTIPLHPFRTKLSLYSSTDAIFSLHLRASSTAIHERSITNALLSRNQGTDVYIFRSKSTTISREWIWFLYLELGGKIPKTLELSVPGIGVKLRLPIPEDLEDSNGNVEVEGEDEGYRSLTSKLVVEACLNQLAGVNDWKEIIEETRKEGTVIKLAWRRGEMLEWVEDGDQEKDFTLLSGFALRQPGLDSSLEIRPAIHYPNTVRLPPTSSSPSRIISEPSSIEGFVNRIKANGATERLYLSSHDGHLFICKPSSAYPPTPPKIYSQGEEEIKVVLKPLPIRGEEKTGWSKLWERLSGGSKDIQIKQEVIVVNVNSDGENGFIAILEREEKLRCRRQILDSRGYIDLVGITEVKLLQPIERSEAISGTVESSRDQRTFLGTLSNGKELKFECNSRAVAKEWVNRLTALSRYWTRRYRVDTFDQMEFQTTAQFSARNVSITTDEYIERRDFESSLSPLLSKLYNQCLTNNCRSIIHHGTFYIKRDAGIYIERHLFLLPSTILEYNTKERDISGRPTTALFHARADTIDLINCYVYSGALTTAFFTQDRNSGNEFGATGTGIGRMYSSDDGLITNDSEEDCTLVIFKKLKGDGKKGRNYVLRARSRIERDVWVFALNSCIARLIREG